MKHVRARVRVIVDIRTRLGNALNVSQDYLFLLSFKELYDIGDSNITNRIKNEINEKNT